MTVQTAAPGTDGKRLRLGLLVGGLVVVLAAALLVGAILVAGWLSGPDDKPVAETEVVGTWQATDGSGLTLRADHTADLRGLPVQQGNDGFGTESQPEAYRNPWTGSGTWLLQPRRNGLEESVTIVFDHATFPLYTSRDGKAVRLFFYIGDSNKEHRYWLDKH
jgi:hypothetical protein